MPSQNRNKHQFSLIQLRFIPFLKQLPDALLQELLPQVKLRHFQKGETIFWEGEMPKGIYWLASGWVKAYKQSADGREQILQFIEEQQSFHEIGAFSTEPNPATLVALSDAEIWLIPKEPIQKLIRENQDFAEQIITNLANRIHYLVALVEDLSLRTVIGRLARLILNDAVDDILHRPRWFTQAELASRLGTVPDVVQRTLRGLEVDGLIRVERRQITIVDRERLEKAAS